MLHDHVKYARSGYKVECTEDGLFAARQCDHSVDSQCWCAEETTGRMIFGTYHASHMIGPYNCNKCEYSFWYSSFVRDADMTYDFSLVSKQNFFLSKIK
jgi:hypothetical protein